MMVRNEVEGDRLVHVLGVSFDYHDAAAALVSDGVVVAAAEEERFTRRKHENDLPVHAIASCLAIAGIGPDDLDAVVLHEKPFGVVSRVLAARQRRGPKALWSFASDLPVLTKRNLLVGYRIEKALRSLGARRAPRIRYAEHHLSHAAAAFHPSGHERAAVLTVDGIGEWSTATVGEGVGTRLDLLAEQRYPDSLGLLYTLATVWCGFAANDGEYKLMGLAPFGEPVYRDALADVVAVDADGSVRVDARLVDWWSGGAVRSRSLASLFGGPPTPSGSPPTQRDADLARSVQEVVEEAVLAMAGHAKQLTGADVLCLGGGVALNCVANGRLRGTGLFDDIWVQPSPGDAGSALGAALWYTHEVEGVPKPPVAAGGDGMSGAFLGPAFSAEEVAGWLRAQGVPHQRIGAGDREDEVTRRLADGDVVGWFQGRMEFGPRALGHRSILADPRGDRVQRDLNVRVKGRESFRPFAPAVLSDQASAWFDLDGPSPYMLFTSQVAASRREPVDREPEAFTDRVQVRRSQIPACTHIDGSARVQTVDGATNPEFCGLLEAWSDRTGCPVLLNTSFNVAGEPIVCTPEDALASARRAGLDLLVLEDCLVELEGTGSR